MVPVCFLAHFKYSILTNDKWSDWFHSWPMFVSLCRSGRPTFFTAVFNTFSPSIKQAWISNLQMAKLALGTCPVLLSAVSCLCLCRVQIPFLFLQFLYENSTQLCFSNPSQYCWPVLCALKTIKSVFPLYSMLSVFSNDVLVASSSFIESASYLLLSVVNHDY